MLLLLAYESLRRRAELASLRVEDIEFDDSARCAILLRKSKTDQSRNGRWIALGPEATATIVAWLDASKITNGFLLRGVRGGKVTEGFDPCLVNRIFKKLAAKAAS
jgi:integrase